MRTMTRRWLTRALLAVALPALLVPTAAAPASAAPRAPEVPTLAQVAKIYPHLKGGDVEEVREPKVRMPTKTCKDGAVIKGAVGLDATYGPSFQSIDDFVVTAKKPLVGVTALTFPSTKVATRYFRASLTEGATCPQTDPFGDDVQLKKLKFKLGEERAGFQIRMGPETPITANVLLIRSGRSVLTVNSMSMQGKGAPAVPLTIKLARLALKTVG